MATITGSAAGGAWNTTGAWVGGVIPLAADDVLLTGTSGNISLPTATTVECKSLDCTGYAGTLTWASTSARLNVWGNCKFVAGMTVTLTGIGILGMLGSAASTTYTLTSGGKTLPVIVVNTPSTTTIQLADNLTTSGTFLHTTGIFDANGKTVVGTVFDTANSGVRTLTLGAANFTLSGTTPWNATTITNLTVTANTATVTMNSSTSATFNGGGANWNGLSLVFTNTSDAVVTGTNTVANLTRTGSATIDSALTLAGNQTITGTFTPTGNAAANRLWVRSSVAGTARTLTVNTTVTASRVDFEDITGAGTASWNLAGITDGSGDMGGNSGITFTAPVTLFARATGNWSTAATWSLTSGGAAATIYPLPQDTAVLNAASGAITVTMNMQRHCTDLTCTGFTGTLILASSATQRYIFGSLTLSAGMTFTATGSSTFAGRGTHTINMAGKAFTSTDTRAYSIGRFGGTYTLTGNANFGNGSGNVSAGLNLGGGVTFDANGFNVQATRVAMPTACTVNMGSGTWTLIGTVDPFVWNNAAPATINASTSSVVIANASASTRTFAGGGKVYYDLTYTVAGSTGGLDITGSNTFHDLNFSDVTNARTLRFTAGTFTTFTGTFNVNGTAGKLMTVGSITAAAHTLWRASGVTSSDYLSISRSLAGYGSSVWYAGANSTDGGNNTGWIFSFPAGGNFFMFI